MSKAFAVGAALLFSSCANITVNGVRLGQDNRVLQFGAASLAIATGFAIADAQEDQHDQLAQFQRADEMPTKGSGQNSSTPVRPTYGQPQTQMNGVGRSGAPAQQTPLMRSTAPRRFQTGGGYRPEIAMPQKGLLDPNLEPNIGPTYEWAPNAGFKPGPDPMLEPNIGPGAEWGGWPTKPVIPDGFDTPYSNGLWGKNFAPQSAYGLFGWGG